LVNTGAPWPSLIEAERRVLAMQTKLHQWATSDPGLRFDDLANLVYDPAFLVVAWDRVRGTRGTNRRRRWGEAALHRRRAPRICSGGCEMISKAGRFVPQRVREKTIPIAAGKVRRLGIATTVDRIVQAALKLVLEPIFETDFEAAL
jgi:RNA-directed DNA polymerase